MALLSKIVTVTLPAALVVIFWWQRGRLSWRRDVLPLVPFFVLGAVAGVFLAWLERTKVGAEGPAFALDARPARFALGTRDLVLPGQAALAGRPGFRLPPLAHRHGGVVAIPVPPGGALAVGRVVAAAAVVAGTAGGDVVLCGDAVSGLGFLERVSLSFSFVADHFQYLASLGIITLAAAGLALLLARSGLWLRPIGNTICLALLVVLGSLTWLQSRMYGDLETLYRVTIAENPDCWMPPYNLGLVLAARGDLEEAMTLYQRTLEIKPDYIEAHVNLGMVLEELGRMDEALAHYRRALEIRPESAEAHNNLGSALSRRGQSNEAIAEYQEALKHRPNFAEAHNNLGLMLAGLGRFDEAMAEYRKALAAEPDLFQAHNNLGTALAGSGRWDEAIAEYQAALELLPDNAEVHNNLGLVLVHSGRLDDAIAQFRKAVELKADFEDARRNLAIAQSEKGRAD